MAITHAAALDQYRELKKSGALRQAARYQLERIAQGLWVFIMGTNDVPADILMAHKHIKTELALRQKSA